MFVHSSRIQKQLEYLSGLGIDTGPLYKQAGIAKNENFSPDRIFDFEQYKIVLEFALRQTNNPNYGLEFGNQPYIGGTLGMLCASCQNLKEAFIKGCQFLKLQGDFAELEFVDDKHYPSLVYRVLESWTLESPRTAKLEVDAMFSFLNTILRINSNGSITPRSLKLRFSKPENCETYERIFGIVPQFNASANEIVFDSSSLLIPMKAFNPETHDILNAHMQLKLSRLRRTQTTSEKVRRILHTSFKYQFPDMDTVAGKLNLSSRTLQRKLSDEQTSFQQILQDAKFGIARKLLQEKTLTISEISYTLGYSDLGNFSRSFKKHTGVSAQEFRETGG